MNDATPDKVLDAVRAEALKALRLRDGERDDGQQARRGRRRHRVGGRRPVGRDARDGPGGGEGDEVRHPQRTPW